MNLKEKLTKSSDESMEKMVKEFADQLIPILQNSAEKGFVSWSRDISKLHETDKKEWKSMLGRADLCERLQYHLPGLKVYTRDELNAFSIFERTTKHLVISWAEESK